MNANNRIHNRPKNTYRLLATLFATLLAGATTLHAHPATERYIPVGESPGISGKYSYHGVIEAHDDTERTLSVRSDSRRSGAIRMSERTRIYLDRSAIGRSNQRGSYADCRPGRKIEVKFVDNDPAKTAEWIKVVVDE